MFGSRPSALVLALLTLIATLGLRSAEAQVPPTQVPPVVGLQVPGSVTVSGDYSARVTEPGKDFWERSGTYLANVSFTASVQVFVTNIAAPSGSYQATGPFTATVSAPDVTTFAVSGTFTVGGTFAASTYTSSGQWVVNTGGRASGSHRGGGTYDLSASTVFASGQYDGVVTGSARGPFNVDGPYRANGSFTVGVMRMTASEALQVSALSDMFAGIAGTAASAPVAAAAVEMQQATVPPAAGAAGAFSGGTIAPAGVSIMSFTGTTAQLNTAAAGAKIVTVSAAVSGKMLVYVVGAPTFVNADFNAAFPTGLNGTLVIVKT